MNRSPHVNIPQGFQGEIIRVKYEGLNVISDQLLQYNPLSIVLPIYQGRPFEVRLHFIKNLPKYH